MPEPVATISAAKLAKLTGFSEAELAKLSRRRYFPPARSGEYSLTSALEGCFRFRKEQAESALPTYTSIAQCSGATGIPERRLRRAKKLGCPGFSYSRVQLEPFLRWFFTQGDSDGQDWGDEQDWGDRLKKAQALRQEIRLNKDRGQALDKGEAQTAIAQAVSVFFAALDRYSDELPAILSGLGPAEIKAQLSANVEQLKEQMRRSLAALTTTTTKNERSKKR